MLEKMKAVSNPLTIIALFAALAEVAGTVSLKFLTSELQAIFIWFVMGFPILLVGLFFYVLITNPKVLYGPGDYRGDEAFLLGLKSEKQALGIEVIRKSLDDAVAKISEEVKKIETTGAAARNELVGIVEQRLLPVQSAVEEAKENIGLLDIAKRMMQPTFGVYDFESPTPKHIETASIDFVLRLEQKPLTIEEIAHKTKIPKYRVMNLLDSLLSKGSIEQSKIDGEWKYRTVKTD